MPVIALSGVDGSGKSTQISLLTEALDRHGVPSAVRWFRPGYSPLARRLKRRLSLPSAASRTSAEPGTTGASHVVGRRHALMSRPGIRLVWLGFAALDSVIEFALVARARSRRQILIYDRWVPDAAIDLRLNFPDWPRVVRLIELLIRAVHRRPDAEILLLVPLETADTRLSGKDEPFPDGAELAARRRDRYEDLARCRPDLVVPGDARPEQVHEGIARHIAETSKLPDLFAHRPETESPIPAGGR